MNNNLKMQYIYSYDCLFFNEFWKQLNMIYNWIIFKFIMDTVSADMTWTHSNCKHASMYIVALK